MGTEEEGSRYDDDDTAGVGDGVHAMSSLFAGWLNCSSKFRRCGDVWSDSVRAALTIF